MIVARLGVGIVAHLLAALAGLAWIGESESAICILCDTYV
jgi:hypothetical protein